jgi:SAM-dependent methyltransferase
MTIDENKLNEFMGRAVGDLGAAFQAGSIVIGERLGLYAAMKDLGPASPAEIAKRTGTKERYVREWLDGQAAGGYVSYDGGNYFLDEIQAFTLADPTSPAYLPGGFEIATSAARSMDAIASCFKTGEGFGWHRHDHGVFHGAEKFFRPLYATSLVDQWIPALEGVKEKLAAGGEVADVGCGFGNSTVFMAKAFPSSRFVGFDYHEGSIEHARKRAEDAGVADRVRFEVAFAKSFPGSYDFVCFFDSLHDMGDPVGIASHVRQALKPGGTWMLVEPFAEDDPAKNHNPVGRVFYNASVFLCTPNSLSQEVGLALGAQAGPKRLTGVLKEGGFGHVRVATTTPFNLIIEARAS